MKKFKEADAKYQAFLAKHPAVKAELEGGGQPVPQQV